MKAKNYRIGNLVKYDNRVFRIHSLAEELPTLDTPEFGIGVVDWNTLKPIELTEEWLINLGFEQDTEVNYRWYHINGSLAYDLDDHCIRIDNTWEFGKRKYVHEMQNLFFALTCEELQLKNECSTCW